MNKMKSVIFTLLMITAISGCLETEKSVGEWEKITETHEWNDYHQFNNVMWAGYANETQLNYTTNGTLEVSMDIRYYFSSLPTTEGSLNISISHDNETVWSNETNVNNQTHHTTWTYHGSLNGSNFSVSLIAMGMDTEPTNDLADYFILKLNASVINSEWVVV